MDQLLQRLQSAGLTDEFGNIVLERYADGYQAVEVTTFREMFDDALSVAESGGEYDALMAADGDRGYVRFFAVWRQMGLL